MGPAMNSAGKDSGRHQGALAIGVSYVAGYQGAPISHLMDVLGDANDILEELGVRFERAPARRRRPRRSRPRSTTRCAAQRPSRPGGDQCSFRCARESCVQRCDRRGAHHRRRGYGEGSSIMQERSHAFAMKSQIWLLDPRPNLPSIVQRSRKGIRAVRGLRYARHAQLRIRACHVTEASSRTTMCARLYAAARAGKAGAEDQPDRAAAGEASAGKGKDREALAGRGALRRTHKLKNCLTAKPPNRHCDAGGMYNTAVRALEVLELADIFGESRIPLYVLNVTYR